MLAVASDASDRIAGCLQLSFIPGLSRTGMWRGQIESVRIARDLRGSGLGSAFIECAIVQCAERLRSRAADIGQDADGFDPLLREARFRREPRWPEAQSLNGYFSLSFIVASGKQVGFMPFFVCHWPIDRRVL